VTGRLLTTVAFLSALAVAPPAFAQARAVGIVRDTEGEPIKGATIKALNPDINSRQVVTTSDAKGRWVILGLRVGTYNFAVEAPGFVPTQGSALVRTAAGAPIVFTLAHELKPLPGALPSNIRAQIAAANLMRDQGRIDQAITAYQDIRNKNSTLTSLNLVIAAAYRQKAALETDATARRAALERAVESYSEMLKAEPDNDRAKAELSATRADVAALPN
jgi:tetratricopeptide (TPR) repeat protein